MNAKRLRMNLLVLVAGCLCLAGVGYGGYRGYKSHRRAHFLERARLDLAKSDIKRALYDVRRVTRANPRDVEAWRLTAQIADALRSPGALLARSRVVELCPHSTEDRLALAETALALRDYATATNALEGIEGAGRNTAAFHNVAGAVASAAGQPARAEKCFLEATRLEPANPVPQLNLAVIRLHGTNAAALEEARASLKRLSTTATNEVLRCSALRELLIDAARNHHAEAALALADALVQNTNSVFKDKLLRLDILRANQETGLNTALAAVEQEAAGDPAKLHDLALWQIANRSSKEAMAWLQRLPRSTQTNPPVALLIAEGYTALHDWPGLRSCLGSQNWGDLDFLRHAFLTRAVREQGLIDSSRTEWEQALRFAQRDRVSLIMLLRTAAQWNWTAEQENLLWTIVRQFPREQWAFSALAQSLFLTGQTRPLMLLYSERVKRYPADLAAKNNLAVTALLLDAREFQPHELARQIYEQSPTNAAFASTYAFSLNLQKKSVQALSVFERLKPQQLEDPAIAGYYGLVLRAAGDQAKAKRFLELGAKAKLLPEERKLIERALAEG
jgi:Flp pilus assembly protein TadD